MLFSSDDDELLDTEGSMFNPYTREARERALEREADRNFPAPIKGVTNNGGLSLQDKKQYG